MSFWAAIGEAILNVKPYRVVYPDESGVFYRCGRTVDTLDAGFYFKIPIVDSIRTVVKAEQVVDVPEIAITAKDGSTYIVSGTINYRVVDADLALNNVYDYDQSLINLAARIIATCIIDTDAVKPSAIIQIVRDKLTSSAEEWGLKIMEFGFNQFAKARVIHLTQQVVAAGVD